MKKLINLYKKYEEVINYLIIGGLTTVISLAIYYISVITFLNPNNALELQIANIISWIGAVIFAYVTNRKVVFKSKNKNIKTEAIKFFGSRILTLLVDMLIMYLSVTVFKFNDKLMKIVSNIIIIVLNYILSKIFVFSRKGEK